MNKINRENVEEYNVANNRRRNGSQHWHWQIPKMTKKLKKLPVYHLESKIEDHQDFKRTVVLILTEMMTIRLMKPMITMKKRWKKAAEHNVREILISDAKIPTGFAKKKKNLKRVRKKI